MKKSNFDKKINRCHSILKNYLIQNEPGKGNYIIYSALNERAVHPK